MKLKTEIIDQIFDLIKWVKYMVEKKAHMGFCGETTKSASPFAFPCPWGFKTQINWGNDIVFLKNPPIKREYKKRAGDYAQIRSLADKSAKILFGNVLGLCNSNIVTIPYKILNSMSAMLDIYSDNISSEIEVFDIKKIMKRQQKLANSLKKLLGIDSQFNLGDMEFCLWEINKKDDKKNVVQIPFILYKEMQDGKEFKTISFIKNGIGIKNHELTSNALKCTELWCEYLNELEFNQIFDGIPGEKIIKLFDFDQRAFSKYIYYLI